MRCSARQTACCHSRQAILACATPRHNVPSLLVVRRFFNLAGAPIVSRNFRQRFQAAAASSEPPALADADGRKALAVFVSGGGSNFKAIHADILSGRIKANVAVVVSDNPSCGGVQYAKDHGIPCMHYSPRPGQDGPGADGSMATAEVLQSLQECGVDAIVLAGFIKLVPAEIVRAYPRSILNIHPGLLPAFGGKGYYGRKVHAAVIASGARWSGPTIHFVDEDYDTGPILTQQVVPVYPTDTPALLAARVLKEEHKLYPEAVAALCDGRITWRSDGVPILWHAR